MRWKVLRCVYLGVCGFLAVFCLWSAFDEWRRWHWIAAPAIYFELGVSAFFALTAISVFRKVWLAPWLAGASGAFLILYAVSVVLLGWEDVGGAAGAVPLSLGAGLAGGVGVVLAVFKRGHLGMAV